MAIYFHKSVIARSESLVAIQKIFFLESSNSKRIYEVSFCRFCSFIAICVKWIASVALLPRNDGKRVDYFGFVPKPRKDGGSKLLRLFRYPRKDDSNNLAISLRLDFPESLKFSALRRLAII